MAAKKTVSSSRASEVRGKAIDKLDAKEFRERRKNYHLLEGTIQRGAPVPSAGVVQGVPPLHKIPPVFIHPNIVRHVRTPALPPTGDGAARFDKGRGEGHVVVRGAWAGLLEHPARSFSPNYSLVVPGRSGIEGPPCGLGGKGVLWLSQQIVRDRRKEMQCKTLLTLVRNLTAVVPGAPRICHQHSPQEDAKGGSGEEEERRDLRKAPGQKRDADSPPKKTPVKRRKLVKKHGKDVKEPTPPMEFAPPPIIHEAEVMIEEPVNAAPHSISSGSGHLAGLNHSSTSLAAVARLANLAEEAASVNHPDSRNPDADAAEAVCATPMEEVGAESQSQPSDDPDRLALVPVTGPSSKKPRSVRNLRSGLLGRLQERQQEIEVSCSSAHDAHPEGGEVEMVTEIPAVPVVVPAEVAPGRCIRP
ncbi:hypothetical protein CK203_010325 [Vitis vinifera]|uniref:Uncharacterized protein n=1 Tax=Vitis vinifera TaxID=29760 RepID=A0A438JY25_VITVI|nr:hypothetical protein CK203_010325 [Vitis vinifera]